MKIPLTGIVDFLLGLLMGAALVLGLSAQAQDAPVDLSVDFSHTVAVPGQKVWLTWRPTSGSTMIQSCTLRLTADGQVILEEAVSKTKYNRDVIMPDVGLLIAGVECLYTTTSPNVPSGVLGIVKSAMVERTTREAILAGTENGPDCYPAPVGSGSKVYGASYRDPDGKDSSCVLWFCGDVPRSFCFRWDLADWSIASLAAVKDSAGLDAKWQSAPWHATSTKERELVAGLFSEYRPRYFTARNSSYTTRPVYERTPEGLRGPLVKTSRVAVGVECDCLDKLETSSRYCSVAGQENALTPGQFLVGPVEGEDGRLSGGSYSLCASQ